MSGVELLARAVLTNPDTYPPDLSVEMIAALRQAYQAGIECVNVVRVDTPDGVEVYIIPTEMDDTDEEPAAGVVETLLAELAQRLGMSKGTSFEVENRMIARNRKRKIAVDPHPFRAARFATRDGRVRCRTCGLTEPVEGPMCLGLAQMRAAHKATADTYTPPKGVQVVAQRALDWIAEGKAGSGFTDTGRARASQLARGDAVSVDTVKRMNSYLARHEVDRQAEGFNAGERGYPSPGRVAWDAWGGDPGQRWVSGIVDSLMKDSPSMSDVHVDTIMPGRGRRKRAAAAVDTIGVSMDKADQYEPYLSERQTAMYETHELLVEMFGLYDQTSGSEGAHYMAASGNPFAQQGMACKNCIFYEGGGGCEIVGGQVEPEGLCKLWIIDETLLVESDKQTNMSAGSVQISKADATLRYTLGPMYVPDTIDAHGEWTDAESLQSAVWDYVRSGDRRIRLQHNLEVVAGEWVECMAWPWAVTVPMLKADESSHAMTYPPNTVFLGVVWEPWAWELVKSGKLRGYSIGGTAERVMADMPDSTGDMTA